MLEAIDCTVWGNDLRRGSGPVERRGANERIVTNIKQDRTTRRVEES